MFDSIFLGFFPFILSVFCEIQNFVKENIILISFSAFCIILILLIKQTIVYLDLPYVLVYWAILPRKMNGKMERDTKRQKGLGDDKFVYQ